MKKMLINLPLALIFVFSQTPLQAKLPPTGLLFNVTTSGLTLNITTTTYNPRNNYPGGIEITTPGYSIVSGCTPTRKGCTFFANQNLTANIVLQGATGKVSFQLCLNEKMPATCALYSVTLSNPSCTFISSYDKSNPALTEPRFSILSGGVLSGRPFENGNCCSGSNPLTDLLTFTVDVTGSYTFTQTTGAPPNNYDTFLLLYTNPLNFGVNPPTTFVVGNDDCSGLNSCFTTTLNAGQTYYLYSTAYSTNGNGSFTTTFSGPGNICKY